MRPDATSPGVFGRVAEAMVAASLRRPRLALLLSALLGLLSLWAVATRFALDTGVVKLFPRTCPGARPSWRWSGPSPAAPT